MALLHAGALVIVIVLPIEVAVKVALFALIGLNLARSIGHHGLRRSGVAVVAVMLSGDECALRRRGSNDWEAGRIANCWVQPWLTLLVVRSDARRRATRVVILPDAVAGEAFRRLRVRLRLRTEGARV